MIAEGYHKKKKNESKGIPSVSGTLYKVQEGMYSSD